MRDWGDDDLRPAVRCMRWTSSAAAADGVWKISAVDLDQGIGAHTATDKFEWNHSVWSRSARAIRTTDRHAAARTARSRTARRPADGSYTDAVDREIAISGAGELGWSAPLLTWSDSLDGGESVDVTHIVTLRAADARGD